MGEAGPAAAELLPAGERQLDQLVWPVVGAAHHPRTHGAAGLTDAEIDDLIARRADARKAKDFAEADRIRGVLSDNGVILEDKPQGTIWRRA